MPETTPLIKAALNLRVGAGFDVYVLTIDLFNCYIKIHDTFIDNIYVTVSVLIRLSNSNHICID